MLAERIFLGPSVFNRIAKEPPFRLLSKAIVRLLPAPVRVKAEWDIVSKPQYLAGIVAAASLAIEDNVPQISVVEFGVAAGAGLLAMQAGAEMVEKEMGVRIAVFGFDYGRGLPEVPPDYRDHPDRWKGGDYPMDEATLRSRLTPRTHLILGDIRDTAPEFVKEQHPPVGFVSIDVDLYTSTMAALQIFSQPGKRMLRRVGMYFDDTTLMCFHKFAGELLAIEDFNRQNSQVKIDIWRGIEARRPFPENPWLKRMFVAHDLEAISRSAPQRKVVRESL